MDPASLAISALVLAGCGAPQMGREPVLRRVEAAFTDRDPLATSMRQFSTDLRQPAGFNDVYQVVGGVDGRETFVRRSGAVWAVFPRGRYRKDEDGKTIAQMPAGTIFSIGTPSALRSEEPMAPRPNPARVPLAVHAGSELRVPASSRLEQRLDHANPLWASLSMPSARIDAFRSGLPAEQPSSAPGPVGLPADGAPEEAPLSLAGDPPPRFVADDEYRRQRLDELLRGLHDPR